MCGKTLGISPLCPPTSPCFVDKCDSMVCHSIRLLPVGPLGFLSRPKFSHSLGAGAGSALLSAFCAPRSAPARPLLALPRALTPCISSTISRVILLSMASNVFLHLLPLFTISILTVLLSHPLFRFCYLYFGMHGLIFNTSI